MASFGSRKARELAVNYGTCCPLELCKLLSVAVIEAPISPLTGYLGQDAYGPYIIVATNLPSFVKNYIIAHELGHYVMHPRDVGFYWIMKNTLFLIERLELDADTFAVTLLNMSESLYEQVQFYIKSAV